MVDNLELVLPFLTFDDENDFYYLQILQRKKENPHLGSNSRVIKNYYINSQEYLIKHYEEIKLLCEQFNARASLRLNRRNYRNVAFKAMVNMANSMNNQEYSFIKKSYDRAVGNGHAEAKDGKTWILDWDGEFSDVDRATIGNSLFLSQPFNTQKIKALIPSKTGMHIIVTPFDSRPFKEMFPEVEIHKDNPTNLYIS